jgi:signal peptidase I
MKANRIQAKTSESLLEAKQNLDASERNFLSQNREDRGAAMKQMIKEWKEWAVSLGIAFLVVFLIQNYAAAQVIVQQSSMEDTLYEGQRLIEEKITYRYSLPKRGDIVIIRGKEYPDRLVKRVIGLPGEKIDIKDGSVYVNDVKLAEDYAVGITENTGQLKLPFLVPEDHVFVLGDNREISLDSRQLGAISLSSIEGKVILRIWPLNRLKLF